MPFSATESAVKRIKEILVKENRQYLRIKIVGGGCSGLHYAIDCADQIEEKMDKVLRFPSDENPEVTVLIDRKSFIYLANTTLNYAEGLVASSFKFINPDATRTCGCGESFAV